MNTKFNTASDFRKSLENRLKNIALKMNYDLQRLRRSVAFDRLLARILFKDNSPFILKGGYAMELRLSNARATKDIDLTCLRRLHESQQAFGEIILEELRVLAFQDLKDFFTFQVGKGQIDLDNAPFGGARFPVSSFIDGKLFVRFRLDVGGDSIVSPVETIRAQDWLGFSGVPAPLFKMISVEQQFAEKLHAYTLPRQDRKNTRVKDLVDMVLLAKMRDLNLADLKNILEQIFKIRQTHSLPNKLEAPPRDWNNPYSEFVKECNLPSMDNAFSQIVQIYEKLLVLNPETKK